MPHLINKFGIQIVDLYETWYKHHAYVPVSVMA